MSSMQLFLGVLLCLVILFFEGPDHPNHMSFGPHVGHSLVRTNELLRLTRYSYR